MDTLFERDSAMNAERSPFFVVGAHGLASDGACPIRRAQGSPRPL